MTNALHLQIINNLETHYQLMVGYRNSKTIYTGFLQVYWKQYFPKSPSYQRFFELMSRAIFPLTLFSQCKCGRNTGIYYIDGSCLPVCHLKRSKRNKVIKEVAAYGRTSVGWFFGLKIHVVINHSNLVKLTSRLANLPFRTHRALFTQ